MEIEKQQYTLLTDLQSFGSIDYYMSLIRYDKLLFEQCQHYVKGSYSNRYYIAGANGRQLLSIPLVQSGRNRTAFKDLVIYDDAWQKQHWRAIFSAYRHSPWFDFYEGELEVMYNRKYKFILDWNLESFELVKNWLKKDWCINKTQKYKSVYDEDDIIDNRYRFLPAKEEEKIIQYPQVFEDKIGFLPHLSILDLLFCEGNNAKMILKK